MTQAPPGWHPDPGGGAQWRYWDGQAWTEHVSPYHAQPAATFARAPRKSIGKGVIVAIVLGALVLLGGCGALIGVSVNRGIHQARKESDRHAITSSQYASVTNNDTRARVKARFGSPARETERDGLTCLSYNRRGTLFNRYELCFSNTTGYLVTR